MRNIYITFLFLIFCSMAHAQVQAKYRVTYDCDAQVVTGKTNTYRWTLDIGETTACLHSYSQMVFVLSVNCHSITGSASTYFNPELRTCL